MAAENVFASRRFLQILDDCTLINLFLEEYTPPPCSNESRVKPSQGSVEDGDAPAAVLCPMEQLPVESAKCLSQTPQFGALRRRHAGLRERDVEVPQSCAVSMLDLLREASTRQSLPAPYNFYERYEVSHDDLSRHREHVVL
jgi:hypothetical protein